MLLLLFGPPRGALLLVLQPARVLSEGVVPAQVVQRPRAAAVDLRLQPRGL